MGCIRRAFLGSLLLVLCVGEAAASPRGLLVLPVMEQGALWPVLVKLSERLRQAGEVAGHAPVPMVRSQALLRKRLHPLGDRLGKKGLSGLYDRMEKGKEAFLMNRYDEAVAILARVRKEVMPFINRAAAHHPRFTTEFFHAMMILGRSLDTLRRSARSQELYRWLVRAFPQLPVTNERYPPSLVSRYDSLRQEARSTTGRLDVTLDGQVPSDPKGCKVYLDGSPRGGVSAPLSGVQSGMFRCAVHCAEGLSSRDYHLRMEPGVQEIRVFLGDDRAIRLGGPAQGPLALDLPEPWQEQDYLGPAVAASLLSDVPRVLLLGPGRSAGTVDLLLIDGLSRRVLRRVSIPEAELPEAPGQARQLLGVLMEQESSGSTPSSSIGDSRQEGPLVSLQTAAWASGAVAAVAGVSAVVMGLRFRSKEQSFEACRDDYACRHRGDELKERRDEAQRYQTLMNLSLGVACTGALAAAVLLVIEHASGPELQPDAMTGGMTQPGPRTAPISLGASMGGWTLSWSF